MVVVVVVVGGSGSEKRGAVRFANVCLRRHPLSLNAGAESSLRLTWFKVSSRMMTTNKAGIKDDLLAPRTRIADPLDQAREDLRKSISCHWIWTSFLNGERTREDDEEQGADEILEGLDERATEELRKMNDVRLHLRVCSVQPK